MSLLWWLARCRGCGWKRRGERSCSACCSCLADPASTHPLRLHSEISKKKKAEAAALREQVLASARRAQGAAWWWWWWWWWWWLLLCTVFVVRGGLYLVSSTGCVWERTWPLADHAPIFPTPTHPTEEAWRAAPTVLESGLDALEEFDAWGLPRRRGGGGGGGSTNGGGDGGASSGSAAAAAESVAAAEAGKGKEEQKGAGGATEGEAGEGLGKKRQRTMADVVVSFFRGSFVCVCPYFTLHFT